MVSFFGTDTSPSSGASSPTIIRKRVVLPAPLGPTRPTFSPGLIWNDASTKRICRPYCLLTFENAIMANDQRTTAGVHNGYQGMSLFGRGLITPRRLVF